MSVAVHTTVVLPNGKVDGALFVTLATPQLSVAFGATNDDDDAAHKPVVEFKDTGVQVITGASLSVIVTVNEHELVFPAASVAVNVLVVVPTGNNEPLAKPDVWLVVTPAQLSVAVGPV